MKKSLIILSIITLVLINFISAYYGSYRSFSLSDLLNSIDASTMLLGAIFIVSFAFINYGLSRFFKDNKATAGIAAFVVSLLITYGINRTGLDFEGFFYDIGISGDFLYTILPIVLLIGVIYLGWKLGFGIAIMIFGVLFILISFTSLIYQKGILILIGISLLVAGFYINKKWPKKKQPKGWQYHQ